MNIVTFHRPLKKKLHCAKVWFAHQDSCKGNTKKANGFWVEVLSYLEKEIKVTGVRSYNSLNGKWKSLLSKVAQFCGTCVNVVRRT